MFKFFLPLAIAAAPSALAAQAAPAEPFVTPNACPFECCQLGPWVARSTTWAFTRERAPTWTAFAVQRGDSVVADSANLWADRLGRVVIPEERFSLDDWDPPLAAPPQPGDTLYLLGYLGEGFWDGWYKGGRYSLPQFWSEGLEGTTERVRAANPGHLVRALEAQWWVHVRRPDGSTAWVWMTDGVAFDGADACG